MRLRPTPVISRGAELRGFRGVVLLLAIETSCDETSVAVVRAGRILSNVVSSQTLLHAEYGGVVPELAAREHLKNLMPVAREALRLAGVDAGQVEAIAATRGPGLPGALLIGWRAAQGWALSLGVPLIAVQHHEAHLYSPWIEGETSVLDRLEPCVTLIVSGGHTLLVRVEGLGRYRVLGSTLDDAAGECFDKSAKLLGLGYPGGPEIDRLSGGGDAGRFRFPRPLMDQPNDDFSFSGLKTAVRYHLRDHSGRAGSAEELRDLCASIQAAVVEVLTVKTLRAARREGVRCIAAAGGVVCNKALRRGLTEGAAAGGFSLRLAEPSLCQDNAAMVGVLGEQYALRGLRGEWADADIAPGWAIDEISAVPMGEESGRGASGRE